MLNNCRTAKTERDPGKRPKQPKIGNSTEFIKVLEVDPKLRVK